MIITSQRTLYNVDLYLNIMLGKPYKSLPNTTLNEKFNVLSGVQPAEGVYPTIRYWGIGTGGNSVVDNTGGLNYSEHGPLDAALFNQIPFVMRPIADDIDPLIKANYRFRTVEVFNNIEYVCYYLKPIPGFDLSDKFYKVSTTVSEDGTKQSLLYLVNLNDPKYLNPEPKDRFITIDSVDATDMYTKIAKLEFNLTEEEIKEIEQVMEIRGTARKTISEIAIITGVDVDADSTREVICAQIAMHVGVNLDLALDLNTKGQIAKVIEIGGGEGLIG